MPLIKRYPNRKLYDTEAKRYVSLEGVADLIRQGAEVKVIDYVTGEEITNQVLAQVIAERERRQGGAVPQSLLAGLIQAGEHTFSAVRRGMVGPLELIRQMDDELDKRVEQLVAGALLEQARSQQLPEAGETPSANDPETAQSPPLSGSASRSDVRRLSAQIDALSEQLEALAERLSSGQ